jgi:SAM-dependent methyltransferase
VDCGCGNAYLTFALYHYLSHVLGRAVQFTGIDVRADLMEKQRERAAALGWAHLDFQTAPIADFAPAAPPDIVIALHACDTATDDALALGIHQGSQLICAVPCCHHHLQAQLSEHPAPAPFAPLARHGILSERLGDLLTDSFRALILRVMGYRTDVVEYVATEHTARNVMIRAVKAARPGEPEFVREYVEMKRFWGVTPYLETLLGEALTGLLKQ